DALYRQQPWCACAWQEGSNFICVCTPDSHPPCYERLACWQAKDGRVHLESRPWHGRYPAGPVYRYVNAVRRRDADAAVVVQWVDSTVGQGTTGAHLYPQSCITHHPVPAELGAAVAHAGRGRWKSENETHTVLKTTGDHVEHHCGHGTQYLAAFLLSRHRLAFLCHTVLAWSDDRYAVLRRVLA